MKTWPGAARATVLMPRCSHATARLRSNMIAGVARSSQGMPARFADAVSDYPDC